ncbi:reverse transcriptase domain-containing protein [Tanacetum coccineum]|uniref:Reverse transcriptase domain-containing protein n=1 Tax=Tanacetum coccineum TaxID=301880 RepID=A0ABQ4YW64_9ASTR
MPFGLKNAGATYQRLVDKAFNSQVGRNVEVYVDDLVIKSYTEAEMLRDVDETFRTRDKTMPRQNRGCAVTSVPMDNQRGLEPQWEVGQSGTNLQATKTALVRATPAGSTQTKEIVDRILVCLLRSCPELNYAPMEKLVLALVFAAKRLRRYFQILADFLVEKPDEAPPDTSVVKTPQEPWTLFTDGSSCVDGSGAGLILTSPEGTEFTYMLRFQFTATNNEAEYEALIAGLRIAAQMGVHNLHVSVDSKLVANQVLGTYIAKEENMVKYLENDKNLISDFANFSISQVPRILKEKSIQEKEVATVVEEEGPTWMTPIVEYLRDGTLPYDKKEASKLRIKARQYELVKAVATITGNQVKKFVWDNIVCRFGLPGEIVSDNGKQFSDNPFKDWCGKLNIIHRFASVKHPQSNRLVERANQSLGEGIKACLGKGNKNWIEELPHVLWAHRTMIKSSHGDTPFSLTYGTEAVIPAEIGMPTYRTNNEEQRLNLDLLEERRERAAIHKAKAKLKMSMYYNARVCGVAFRSGDFVYHSNEASHAMDGGKLGPKWEGPYEVTKALGDGAYRLRSLEGTVLPRTWNIANLKKCYL